MVTLKELAKILNVSVSTVSKALNDSPEIGQRTKTRILELAKELNYRPNRIAQQLKSNQTRTIGVIIPTVINPFFAEALHGIEQEAAMHNYDIIVCLSNESLEKEIRSVELLSNGSVDGFVMALSQETQTKEYNKHLQSLMQQNIPVVLFDRSIHSFQGHYVVIDDYHSVYDVVNYLIEKEQRQHILLLSNIEDLSVGKRRIEGYKEALKEKHLEPAVLNVSSDENSAEQIKTFLDQHPNADAVVSIDHLTGVQALNYLKDKGVSIPKQVSVIGFGSPSTQMLTSPEMAVVFQKAEDMGKKSMGLLSNILSQPIKERPKQSLNRMKSALLNGETLL